MTSAYRTAYEACPLCDAPTLAHMRTDACTRHPLYRGLLDPQLHWMSCTTCGHVCTDSYFNDAGLALLFLGTGALENPVMPLPDAEFRRNSWGTTIAHIADFVSAGRWLDVGTGSGTLLRVASELGYDVAGTDLRADTVAALRKEGFAMHHGDIADVPEHECYDVVSLCDVLEHMPFPRRALAAASGLLKASGFLFMSFPNYDTPLWQRWDRESANPYWGEIEHYHNFSRNRMLDLLAAHGFRHERTWISPRYRGGIDILASKRRD